MVYIPFVLDNFRTYSPVISFLGFSQHFPLKGALLILALFPWYPVSQEYLAIGRNS